MSEVRNGWEWIWDGDRVRFVPPLPEPPAIPSIVLPQVNPDRRACPGCVGPGGVAELQRRLAASEAEVARLQRCMRRMGPPVLPHDALQDRTQTPNERAYDALMAEREKRKRAGKEIGQMLRLNDWAIGIGRAQLAQANRRADEMQRRADSVPLLEDKVDRLKAEVTRMLNNEAPLRAGYLEACAERDELRKKQATVYSQAQMNDAGAFEKLRQELMTVRAINKSQSDALATYASELVELRPMKDAYRRAAVDAERYREMYRTVSDYTRKVNHILAQDEKPRRIVKKLRRLTSAI